MGSANARIASALSALFSFFSPARPRVSARSLRSAAKLLLPSLHFLSCCRQHPQLRPPSPSPSRSLCLSRPPQELQLPPRPCTSDARAKKKKKNLSILRNLKKDRKQERRKEQQQRNSGNHKETRTTVSHGSGQSWAVLSRC